MNTPRYEVISVSETWVRHHRYARVVFKDLQYNEFFYDVRDNPEILRRVTFETNYDTYVALNAKHEWDRATYDSSTQLVVVFLRCSALYKQRKHVMWPS